MAYELLSESRKFNKQGGPNKSRGEGGNLKKKISGATLVRDPRVIIARCRVQCGKHFTGFSYFATYFMSH